MARLPRVRRAYGAGKRADWAPFALPLDKAGHSVKGQLVAKFLSQRLGMDMFASKPA
jgi:glutaminase